MFNNSNRVSVLTFIHLILTFKAIFCTQRIIGLPNLRSYFPKREITDEEFRQQLCHNGGHKIRYHQTSEQCYTLGEQGPCGKNMIFIEAEADSVVGECNCIQSIRTTVYHPKSEQCHFILQQAYCSPGEWLVISIVTKKPICQANPCQKLKHSGLNSEYVILDGDPNKCVELGKSNTYCSTQVNFQESKMYPTCIPPSLPAHLSVTGYKHKCKYGSPSAILGYCQPPWPFDDFR